MASRLGTEHWRILRDNLLFGGLSDVHFDDLTTSARLHTFRKGQVIFMQGDMARHVYVVARGGIRLYRMTGDGREATVNVFHRPQCFGEAAIFLEQAFPVTAQAIETTDLIKVDAVKIVNRIKTDPAVALGLLASMSIHLKTLIEEITLLRTQSTAKRLASLLLSSTGETEGQAEFELPHNKTVLAKRLDVAPEVLSRTLASLRERGVVISRRQVKIDNIGRLRNFVES